MSFSMAAAGGPIQFVDITPVIDRSLHNFSGDSTIHRSIIHIDSFILTVPLVGAVDERWSMGIITANDATLVGIPNPDNDITAEWYYWTFRSFSVVLSSVSINFPSIDVDIHSRRRIEAGKKLLVVVNNPANTNVLGVVISMRNLWTGAV